MEETPLEEEIWQKLERNAEKETEKVVVDDSVWRPNIIYIITPQNYVNPKIVTALLDAGFDHVIPYTQIKPDSLIDCIKEIVSSRPPIVSRKPRILLDLPNEYTRDANLFESIQKSSDQTLIILENNNLFACTSAIISRSLVALDLLSLNPRETSLFISKDLSNVFEILDANSLNIFKNINMVPSITDILNSSENAIIITTEKLEDTNANGKNVLFSLNPHNPEYDNYDGKILGNVSVIGSSVISSLSNKVHIEIFKYGKVEPRGFVDFNKFLEFSKEILNRFYFP